LSKADVIRQWKPELKSLGFEYQDGMFVYDREEGPLDLAISIQKNVRGETYKINPTILFRNSLLAEPKREVIVLANVRADGIFLHVARSSWWPENALADALRALKQHVLDWFHRVGRVDHLAEIAETAIREKKSIAEVIEPLDEAAAAPPWLQGVPRQVGPMFFYQAAVLHYLKGDRDKALARTRDWLAAVSAGDINEKSTAQAQLNALTRPN
jgi:hypothetical protein